MVLLVGLGNPGADYSTNRHNIGFMVIDAIHRRYGFPKFRKKFMGEIAEGTIEGRKVRLLKPMTYMNDSGRSVNAARKFYKVDRGDIVVFHDELDLAPGKLRAKSGGGYAGHNGLKSIGNNVGPDFRRIRIGIGHPGDKKKVTGHVLRNFSKADRAWVEKTTDAIAEAVPILVAGDDPAFLSKVALIINPPVHKPRPVDLAGDAADEENG